MVCMLVTLLLVSGLSFGPLSKTRFSLGLRELGALAGASVFLLAWVCITAGAIYFDRPQHALITAAVGTLGACLLMFSFSAGKNTMLPPAFLKKELAGLPLPLLAAMAGFVFWFTAYTITFHHALWSSGYDLGIFNEEMHNIITTGKPYSTILNHILLGEHFSPILYLCAPFYALYPHAESLLVMQCLLCAFAAIPVYKLAVLKLGKGFTAQVIALSVMLYPGMSGLVTFEFHEFCFAPLLLAYTLLFLEKRRFGAYAVLVFLCLCIKEDMAIACTSIGLFALFNRETHKAGLFTCIISVAWLVIVTTYIIPFFNPDGYRFMNERYAELYNGRTGISAPLITLFTKPRLLFKIVFVNKKILLQVLVLGPLLYLPLLRLRNLVFFLPLIATSLLSSALMQYQVNFHYLAASIPLLFFATINTMQNYKCSTRRVLGAGILASSFLLCTGFGRMPFSKHVSGLWVAPGYAAALPAFYEAIPKGARVSVSNQLHAHIGEKVNAVLFPVEYDSAPYILLDANLSINEGGCKSSRKEIAGYMLPLLKAGKYGIVKYSLNIMLLQKGRDTSGNSTLIKDLESMHELYEAERMPAKYPFDITLRDLHASSEWFWSDMVSGLIAKPGFYWESPQALICKSPALPFGAGSYRFHFRLQTGNHTGSAPIARIFVSDSSSGILKTQVITANQFIAPDQYQVFTLDITVPAQGRMLQFGVYYLRPEDAELRVDYVEAEEVRR